MAKQGEEEPIRIGFPIISTRVCAVGQYKNLVFLVAYSIAVFAVDFRRLHTIRFLLYRQQGRRAMSAARLGKYAHAR